MSFIKNLLLSIIGMKPKKPKIKQGKTDIHLPFSRSGEDKRVQDRNPQDSNAIKTKIGLQAEKPIIDYPTKSSSGESLSCPECQYPLRVEPSKSSPCPNCGFSGNNQNPENTVYNPRKTMTVSSLDALNDMEIQEFKFKLIEEASQSEIKIQSDESELVLNRSHLDPNNMNISSEQHVLIKFRLNKIFIEDVSSNGSTFIQVKNSIMIQPGNRLVIGNKIYLFNLLQEQLKSPVDDKATRRYGDMNNQEGSKGFALTDEKSGKRMVFNDLHVIINRSNLDTSNNSISGSRHAGFDYEDGCWYLKDLSSTGATFIQVNDEYQLESGMKLIIGNKIYRFEYDL